MTREHDDTAGRAAAYEASDDVSLNPSPEPTLGDIVQRRFNRRELLRGALGLTAVGVLGRLLASEPLQAQQGGEQRFAASTRFSFSGLEHGIDRTHHVAPGYRADVLLRWGDAVLPDAPVFDPHAQSADAQRRQFGYNNDFIGFIPLPFGSGSSEQGLLCVNHEYSDEDMMFANADRAMELSAREIAVIEMASHGGSIVELRKIDGRWRVVPDSRYARRITALDTEMRFAGPAAGNARLRISDDPEATRVLGTLNNCAGGITPWGTWLMAEENFHGYFSGRLRNNPERSNYERYGVPGARYDWAEFDPRFDLDAEPNGANRYGWIVEVDPLDPQSVPVKRTALGRFKHEGAASIVNGDGRLVVYSGDDQRFEFLYRFVTAGRVNMQDRSANRDLLDHGTLYAARFDDDGRMTWLPLVYGSSGLDPSNGFHSQADVVIEARRAATLLGATPMDRPEDVEANPANGHVYVMLTNNSRRSGGQVDAANPRAANLWGHVLELIPEGGDHAANRGRWEILVKAGDPANPSQAAAWNPATGSNEWFACPDNCAVDPAGRLWVATDQGSAWRHKSGTADGLWALETEGVGRGMARMLFRAPVGAETAGPCFTPDGRTLFVAVQHPGADGTKDFPGFNRRSTFDDPATRWPDFDQQMPPRPSVLVITRDDGGVIGG